MTGTYLDFVVKNPFSEECWVMTRLDRDAPGDWSVFLGPAGTDSVMMAPGETQTRTLYVTPGTPTVATFEVYEDVRDGDGDFLRRTGGLTFVVSSGTTGVPEKPGAPRAMLLAPRPNPMRSESTLSFVLPTPNDAKVAIYDASGRLVAEPFVDHAPAGRTDVVWSGRDRAGRPVASGIYFVRFSTAAASDTRKLLVIH
jgi:hypothetical protein